ncbi:MAG: 3-dehydroquinate synthase [Gammaproteobacteria bacterium]|nr:3-dehydroquinate synthase [Gammaproteobacteria bacterium]MDH3465847.1 3-dehydroquinate synthase [Gammaproteobacteria bacterium]
MKEVVVNLPHERHYPIYIGPGLLAESERLRRHVTGTKVFVITNDVVAPLYLDQLLESLRGLDVYSKILADGESHKTLDTAATIFDALIAVPCDRETTVISLGGGVTGDIAGFAAACYQRGIPYIQIPTTLLAQVDSAVGGKTAVNHPYGKNMIGVFHQPVCVISDTDTLSTLDDRQLRAGLAETIKYGLIRDPEFANWLEANVDALLTRDSAALSYAVERSCQIKAAIVSEDECERGVRAILNFGHTFGHAIETGQGYGAWLHGEAVAAGMVIAARVSNLMGWLSSADYLRTENLLQRVGLPIRAPVELTAARLIELMAVDKKVSRGTLRLILLKTVGDARIVSDYPADVIKTAIEQLRDTESISAR